MLDDAGVEAARNLASRFTVVGSEQWHLLVRAIAAHTEAAVKEEQERVEEIAWDFMFKHSTSRRADELVAALKPEEVSHG